MIQRGSLTIKLFSECNMNCSFCIQRTEKKYNCLNLLPILKEHLEECSYNTIFIMGGEPLLIPSYVVQLSDLIKEIYSETQICILTNGSLLTKGLVGYFNKIDAGIILSVNGASGEKSLAHLIQMAGDSRVYETLGLIEDLVIRKVITRGEDNFADDVILLRSLLNAKIQMVPDYTTLDKFDIKDLFNFERNIAKMHRFFNKEIDWLSLNGTGCMECSCEEQHVMHSDGSVVTLADDTGVHGVAAGCAMFQQEMGEQNYRLYQKTLSKYFQGGM